jgi:hypothetical protein
MYNFMPNKRRDPALEKAKDYKQQSVNVAEYPKRAVVSRRKKKKGLNRQVRRKVGQLLHQETPLRDDQEHRLPESLKIRRVPKADSANLGKALEYKLARRSQTLGANYFKQPYSSRLREGFVAFLEGLTAGDSDKTVNQKAAAYFAKCLTPHSTNQWRWFVGKHAWLEAFFRDAPEWRERLEKWIGRMQE